MSVEVKSFIRNLEKTLFKRYSIWRESITPWTENRILFDGRDVKA